MKDNQIHGACSGLHNVQAVQDQHSLAMGALSSECLTCLFPTQPPLNALYGFIASCMFCDLGSNRCQASEVNQLVLQRQSKMLIEWPVCSPLQYHWQ